VPGEAGPSVFSWRPAILAAYAAADGDDAEPGGEIALQVAGLVREIAETSDVLTVSKGLDGARSLSRSAASAGVTCALPARVAPERGLSAPRPLRSRVRPGRAPGVAGRGVVWQ
jgi:hypothetical protein